MKILLIEAIAIFVLAGVVGTAVHQTRGNAEKKIPLVPPNPSLTYPEPFTPSTPGEPSPPPEVAPQPQPTPPAPPVNPVQPREPTPPVTPDLEVVVPDDPPAGDKVPEVSIEVAFAEYEAGGALFIDARHGKQYREGHIEGARSLSPYVGDFEPKLEEILNEHEAEAPVLIYCTGGKCKDSHSVAQRFKLAGYMNIMVVKAGFDGWKKAGHPVETGEEKTE